jgi:CheY-like chemotaxis protein
VKIGDGVGTSYVDITATKRLERELQERAEALQRADRNKSEFLALLSHELRNPLAPLVNGLSLLRTGGGDKGPGARVLEMMERQLAQLVRLIDDLLDISRIDRGKLDLHRERLAADALVRSAVEISRPNIEARRHELVLRFPGDAIYVEADPVRMAQVLSNVLNNAAKFTPPGGRIELRLSREGDDALISVADSGVGLSAEDRERISGMFVQLDSSRSQAAGGLGLGLTLARTIVDAHGGKIWAESDGPEKGSRFVVRLPSAPAPLARPRVRAVPSGKTQARRILVVDDNVDAATSLASLLEFAGHEVRTVFNGSDVLPAAEEFRPECIVLDLNLPGMDGLEVGRRLRTQPWGRDASLIALTGMGQPTDHARTRAAGFDHHITKPIEPAEVLALVAKVR